MKTERLLFVIAAACFLSLGCGREISKKGDPPANNGVANNGASNNGASNNGASNNGASNNGASNNGASNNGTTTGNPCAAADPTSVAFGSVDVGETVTATFSVGNCSPTEDLRVDGASITGPFRLEGVATGMLRPQQSQQFTVVFEPTEAGAVEGRATVQTSDGNVTVELGGVGIGDAECPEVFAFVLDANRNPVDSLTTVAQQTAELAGDTVGDVTKTQWTILSRPSGSMAQPMPDFTLAANLFLDLPGTYVAELAVWGDGPDPCATDTVEIEALPTDDEVLLQVVWDTDQTDVDIHYRHGAGVWNAPPWDIFWDNPTADWGAVGPADDPSLDLDDSEGFGPENITHSGLEAGVVYSFGAYYYNDATLGATNATTRIFIDGIMVFEETYTFAARGHFLHAANIDGATKNVSTIGSVRDGFP